MKTTKIQLVYNYIKSATKKRKRTTYKEIADRTGIPMHMVTVYGRILARSNHIKYAGSALYSNRVRKSFVDAEPGTTKVGVSYGYLSPSRLNKAKVKALTTRLGMILKFVIKTSNELCMAQEKLEQLQAEIDSL